MKTKPWNSLHFKLKSFVEVLLTIVKDFADVTILLISNMLDETVKVTEPTNILPSWG